MSKEIWKPVVGFEYYDVSNLGRVRSWLKSGGKGGTLKVREIPRILSPSVTPKSYAKVDLSNGDGTFASRLIHVLVLEAFCEKCPSGYEAGHLDGNKHNNYLGNLRWITGKENARHRKIHGVWYVPKGEQNGQSKLTESEVNEILEMYFWFGFSVPFLAKVFDVSRATVYPIVRCQTWCHVDFWKKEATKIAGSHSKVKKARVAV